MVKNTLLTIVLISGHFNNKKSQKEFNEEVLNLIKNVEEGKFGNNRSEFDLVKNKKWIEIATPQSKWVKEEDVWFDKSDIEQFLLI